MEIVTLVIVLFVLIALIGGMIKTFRRNWVLALALMLLVFPIWILWAFGELFTGEIKPKVIYVKNVE